MSNLFEKHAYPLVIEIKIDEDDIITRTVAEIFPTANGIVFFDLWWHLNDSGHPIHVIEGKITGNGPWRVGNKALIRYMSEEDPYNRWAAWMRWKEAIEKSYVSREIILKEARFYGALV